MKLEDQVCSIELAKKLKELGVNSPSLFFWTVGGVISRSEALPILESNYKAFTVAELGNMLLSFNLVTHKYKKGKNYVYGVTVQDIQIRINKTYIDEFNGKTESDARAKMLIHLIEKNLIDVKDLNNEI